MPTDSCGAECADAEHATTRTSPDSCEMPGARAVTPGPRNEHAEVDEAARGTRTAQARIIEAVENMLAELATPGAPMPHRDRVADVLASALDALKPSPSAKEPSEDMLRALAAMVAEPRIVSTGDLGRALDPSLNTERACALGGNRMRQMLARGWVVRERFARWAVTEEGRAAHERGAGWRPGSDRGTPGGDEPIVVGGDGRPSNRTA
jgi:hypothetical protein